MDLSRAALLCLLAVPFAGPANADPAAMAAAAPLAVPLAAHRAVYDLSLSRTEGNRGPSYARGRIAFDFSGTPCEGYAQNFRQFTEMQSAEGPARVSDMRSATFETPDGKNFRFKVETDVDRSKVETSDGRAVRSDDGALSVNLSAPSVTKVDLDKDVLFPTEHLRHIIEAARNGEHLLTVKVFDGSETGQKVFDTTAVIGKVATGAVDDASKRLPDLAAAKRWPVAISYFEEGKRDSQPNYVLSFDLYENGISRALKLDYGDFVLSGNMVELELLPTQPCASTAGLTGAKAAH
jgi:hypothetical protein